MSEEQVQNDSGAQLAAVLPQAQPSEASEKDSEQVTERPQRNADYQPFVDLSDLPEDKRSAIEGRFNHFSKLMKKNEAKYNNQISEWRKMAEQQSKVIEELQSGMGAVVDHLQESSIKDTESKLQQELMAAHESGDVKAFISANDRLAELKAKKIALEQQKKAPKQKQDGRAQPVNVAPSAQQWADEAMTDGDIDSEDARAIGAWQTETDASGTPLRPWSKSRNPQDPLADPLYRRALIESAAVFEESSPWANRTVAEKLAEIDRRMGVTRTTNGQNVMGGQLTTPKKNTKITLTPFQEQIAIKKKFGGPKAKSDAEHLEAFRKQLEKVNATKGVRK